MSEQGHNNETVRRMLFNQRRALMEEQKKRKAIIRQAGLLYQNDERLQELEENIANIRSLEDTFLKLELSGLRTQLETEIMKAKVEAIKAEIQAEKLASVRRAQEKSGCGCLVLMAAGLSAFSLFSIYQI